MRPTLLKRRRRCGRRRRSSGSARVRYIKDVTERLSQLNPALAVQARAVLDVNKQERHIRGGMATREKYLHLHS